MEEEKIAKMGRCQREMVSAMRAEVSKVNPAIGSLSSATGGANVIEWGIRGFFGVPFRATRDSRGSFSQMTGSRGNIC